MDDAMFDDLARSLEQDAAHASGETVPGLRVHVPHEVDVAAIRKATDLSQDVFASRIGVAVAVGTLRNWEQGRRKPEGPARVLLALLERNPCLVEEALGCAGDPRGGSDGASQSSRGHDRTGARHSPDARVRLTRKRSRRR